MKNIEQIANEFQEVVKGEVFISENNSFLHYFDYSGYYKDSYYDVIFYEDKNNDIKIRVAVTTDNVEKMVSIIKKIEPLAKIETVKKIVTYETIIL